MDQPSDDRHRGPSALRVAGVGLGVLGATFGGVAGWFTLAPYAPVAGTGVVSTHTGSNPVQADAGASPVGPASGRVHTRTGGS